MSMFDDLDPVFAPSADVALERVAVRVHKLRVRRRVKFAGALGTVVFVTALGSTAFAVGHSDRPRVAVNEHVTSTTGSTTTTKPKRATIASKPRSVAHTTTSTRATTPTTRGRATANAPTGTTQPPFVDDVVTAPRPKPQTAADLHVVFAANRLVARSGSLVTISYTVTNTGDGTGYVDEAPSCVVHEELVPNTFPSWWPRPADGHVDCQHLRRVAIYGHGSQKFTHTVRVGFLVGDGPDFVPAPAGEAAYRVLYENTLTTNNAASLPITITAPGPLPFSSTFPAHVTVASGAAHTETFTLTNGFAFRVSFGFVGPCIRAVGSTTACVRIVDGGPSQLWQSSVTVPATDGVTLVMDISGTSDLMPPGPTNRPLAPGTYQFQGPGGLPLTLTVTP